MIARNANTGMETRNYNDPAILGIILPAAKDRIFRHRLWIANGRNAFCCGAGGEFGLTAHNTQCEKK
jgi:Fe-S oxidoreductase